MMVEFLKSVISVLSYGHLKFPIWKSMKLKMHAQYFEIFFLAKFHLSGKNWLLIYPKRKIQKLLHKVGMRLLCTHVVV